jgi:hypothetical protein
MSLDTKMSDTMNELLMNSNSVTRSTVPRLGDDYESWRPLMVAYLGKMGIKDMHYLSPIDNFIVIRKQLSDSAVAESLSALAAFSGNLELPVNGSSSSSANRVVMTDAHKKTVTQLIDLSIKAYGLLYEALSDDVRRLVQSVPSGYAHGVWKYLEVKYQGEEMANRVKLIRQIHSLEMQEGELFETFKARVDQIKRRLVPLNEEPSAAAYVGILFHKLPASYSIVFQALVAANKLNADADIEWVVKYISEYERSVNKSGTSNNESSEVTFGLRGNRGYNGNGKYAKNKTSDGVQCYNCRQTGHVKWECPKRSNLKCTVCNKNGHTREEHD